MPGNVNYVGPERQLNFNTGGFDGITGFESLPAVTALASGGYAVGYTRPNGANPDIFFQYLDANGVPIGNTFSTAINLGAQDDVSLAPRADGGFVGAFRDNVLSMTTYIRLDNFAPGSTSSTTSMIFESGVNFSQPDLARLTDGRFLVLFTRGFNDVSYAVFDPATNTSSAPTLLTGAGSQFDPSVAANATTGTAVGVWLDGDFDNPDVKLRLFSGVTPIGPELTVQDTFPARAPDVTALTDGRYVVVWEQTSALGDEDIKAKIFDPATNSFSPEIAIAGGGGFQGDPVVAALPGGRFIVTWTDATGGLGDLSGTGTVGRRFEADGSPAGDEFAVNASTRETQITPALASHQDGRFLTTWTDASQQNTTDLSNSGIKGQAFALPGTGNEGGSTDGTPDFDVLRGYGLNEVFRGFGGDDFVFGAGGNDQIFGGADDDNLNGDNGNDRLFGEAGFDILKGGAGDDIVSGGRGNDILRGGVGRDAFRFDAAPNAVSNKDLVVDFRSVDDIFHIDNAVFRKVGANGRLKADAFHLGARAEDPEDRIIYHKATGTLFYDPDGTGRAAQIEFAQLVNKAVVRLNDFLIV